MAQTRALLDPRHPKRAMWLSVWTPTPPIRPSLVLPTGGFYGSVADCRRLEADPSDEQLAAILGYVEPKSMLRGYPLAVQARDTAGCVISEMLSSPSRLPDAVDALAGHGSIVVVTMEEVLARRLALAVKERRDG